MVSAEIIQYWMEATFLSKLWISLAAYSKHGFVMLFIGWWAAALYQDEPEPLHVAISLSVSLLITIGISEGVRLMFPLQRPFVLGGFDPLLAHEANPGFPSNHATATAAFTGVLLWIYPRSWGSAILLISFMTGLARIVTGLHFPRDILAGWLLGGCIGVSVSYYTVLYKDYIPGIMGAQSPDQHP